MSVMTTTDLLNLPGMNIQEPFVSLRYSYDSGTRVGRRHVPEGFAEWVNKILRNNGTITISADNLHGRKVTIQFEDRLPTRVREPTLEDALFKAVRGSAKSLNERFYGKPHQSCNLDDLIGWQEGVVVLQDGGLKATYRDGETTKVHVVLFNELVDA